MSNTPESKFRSTSLQGGLQGRVGNDLLGYQIYRKSIRSKELEYCKNISISLSRGWTKNYNVLQVNSDRRNCENFLTF